MFINRKYYYLALSGNVENQFNPSNRFVVCLFLYCLLFKLSFSPTCRCGIWSYSPFVQVTILTMFTLITLYSTIIPISLYVSIEVLVADIMIIILIFFFALSTFYIKSILTALYLSVARWLNLSSALSLSTKIWTCIILRATPLHWPGHPIWMRSLDRHTLTYFLYFHF